MTSTTAGVASQQASARLLLVGTLLCFASAELLYAIGVVPAPHQLGPVFFPFGAICMFTAWITLFAWALPKRQVAMVSACGVLLAVVFRMGLHRPWLACLGVGLGVAALVAQVVLAVRAPREKRPTCHRLLAGTLLFPLFALVSQPFLSLTAALRPRTWDHFYLAADFAFGGQPSYAVGRLFHALPWLSSLCGAVYVGLPVTLAIVLVAEHRRSARNDLPFIEAFALTALVGWLSYLLVPVAGPAFVMTDWPTSPSPQPDGFLVQAIFARPHIPRNCMPSLHTAWALLGWASLRRQGRWLNALGIVQLVLTELATLGLGFHWAWDLLVAVPFTLGIRALFAPASSRRRLTLVIAWVLMVLLIAIPIKLPLVLAKAAPAGVPLAMGICYLCWLLDRRLFARKADPSEVEQAPLAHTQAPTHLGALLTIYFVSGFAGLCYEVVFAKSLGLLFGSTIRASTLVLTVYMSGIALGSWWGGRLAARTGKALRLYALAEGFIGLWCAATLFTIWLVRNAYTHFGHGTVPTSQGLLPLQMLIAFLVLFAPTFAMGLTTPLLARHLTDERQQLGTAVGSLYGANTLGAATGALVTGYFILPAMGVSRSTLLAVALNLVATYAALRIAKHIKDLPPRDRETSEECNPTTTLHRRTAWLAIAVLAVGGFVTFALETTCIHLLAVVVGNSAFAFALMVFCFLVGLSAGALLATRWLRAGSDPGLGLVLAQLGVATSVLLGLILWDGIPGYFASFEYWPLARTFPAREFIRFAVCCVAMIPPAGFIGAAYPLCMELVGRSCPGSATRMRWLGVASGLNTVGNIAGAIVGGMFLVDLLGSRNALVTLAVTSTFLAALALLATAGRKRAIAAAGLLLPLACLGMAPRAFDFNSLSSGANVYFSRHNYGPVIDVAESVEGGLTSITEVVNPDGQRTLTMLTNGKFQGDDGENKEMAAQYGIAVAPLLHTTARGPALVIGLGTGVTARVVADAGFSEVHVAELSQDIVSMARRHFQKVNLGVLERPHVATHIADGRNLLLLTDKKFDLISIEVSSIWFAGSANLYSREFYAIARHALSQRGVLQQWLQLHRLSRRDIATIIGTMRSEFPQVYVYRTGPQGVLVGCQWDCAPTPASLDTIDHQAQLQNVLALLGGSSRALVGSLLLGPPDVDRMLDEIRSKEGEELLSTDDNLFLEYSTPKANVRPYFESFKNNVSFLMAHRSASVMPTPPRPKHEPTQVVPPHP